MGTSYKDLLLVSPYKYDKLERRVAFFIEDLLVLFGKKSQFVICH